ncbi:MAG: PHP domain-containing protein [Ignavibacteriales bacterium]|nr:PHP domain-containing protein [Ignavibacteriales bacterium]
MVNKVDLHTHTIYSDGSLTPKELINLANKNDITTISITDHDNILGVKEAQSYGEKLNVEVISGVEISTDIEDFEVHLLGLFIDIENIELNKYLNFFREERYYRAKRIIKKLNNLGLPLSIDDVEFNAKYSAIGRPHIAKAMLEKGLIQNYYEAFEKYIGDNGPAYERKIHISPISAIKLINDANGLCFIAHPNYIKENILIFLIKSGIDGIEVVHPSHKKFQIRFYREVVNHYCLLETGGSDYHGHTKNDDDVFGKYYISYQKLNTMKKMLIKHKI